MCPKIVRFSPEHVRITSPQYLAAQQAGARYVLELDSNRLLYPFRREAGIAQPSASNPPTPETDENSGATGTTVQPYPNWESTGLDGHIAGHYLSACVAFAQATGEHVFIDRAAAMVTALRECQCAYESDELMRGFVGGIPHSRILAQHIAQGHIAAQHFALNGNWVPLYNLHKICAGLLDAWEGLSQLDPATSEMACRIVLDLADWWCRLTESLDENTFSRMLICEFGGMCEVFAELYARTGCETYKAMAYRFVDTAMLEPLSQGKDTLTGMHANTQIPKVLGWERLDEVCADPACRAATETFWQSVVHHRSVSIGAHSVSEHFHQIDDFSPMIQSREGPETCNSYNMSKLAERLWIRNPQPEYLDFYERVLENHILSTVNPQHPGFVYFTPMRPRHYRVYSAAQQSFWCCVGSGLENHARYGRLIFAQQIDAQQIDEQRTDEQRANIQQVAEWRTARQQSNDHQSVHVMPDCVPATASPSQRSKLLVNLYIGAELDWEERHIHVSQHVSYSQVDGAITVSLRITPTDHRPQNLTVCLRKPWWAKDFRLVGTTCVAYQHHTNTDQVDTHQSDIRQAGSGRSSMHHVRNSSSSSEQNTQSSRPRVDKHNQELRGYQTYDLYCDGEAQIRIRITPKVTAQPLPDGSEWVSYMVGPTVMALRETDTHEKLVGQFADDSRMGHIAAGPLCAMADMPVIAGEPSAAVVPNDGYGDTQIDRRLYVRAVDNQGKPTVLALEPFTSIHESRYSIYIPVACSGNVEARRHELAHTDQQQAQQERSTVDIVVCGRQQSEVDHQYSGMGDIMGTERNMQWRCAQAGGSFAYAMRADGATRLDVAIYAKDTSQAYVISVDDQELVCCGRQEMEGDPCVVDVYDLPYKVSAKVAAALADPSAQKSQDTVVQQQVVRVVIQALPNDQTPRISSIRIVTC